MSRHDPRTDDLRDELKFFQHLGNEDSVDVEPGINQDEFFDDQFERRAHEIQRTPGSNSTVSVVPMKRGPWSGNNQLGVERAFAPDDSNRQTIIRLDEWDFPQVWSVMLGVKYSDEAWGASASAAFAVTAEVEAGVGGAVQEFEVDWCQGTTFSMNMNALNIVASYRASPINLPSDLRLVATISRRKLTGLPPTRSFNLAAVVPGGVAAFSEIIRIPDFARTVVPMDNGSVPNTWFQPGIELQFLSNPNGLGGVCGRVNGVQLANYLAGGVPIPLFARYMRVSVDALVVAFSGNLIFNLGL